MRLFHNTPQPHNAPTHPKQRTGTELLHWLEDAFRDYREDCALGLCKEDPAVVAKFKADIAAAKAEVTKPR